MQETTVFFILIGERYRNMKNLTAVLKTLSDENRLRIFLMLKGRPLCVCEIYEILDIALSTLSQHLRLMKTAGMVSDRKDGRWVIYSLNIESGMVKRVIDFLDREIGEDEIVLQDRRRVAEISREICCTALHHQQDKSR